MNSTAIGNKFEEKVFKFFEKEITGGRFVAPASHCQIFRKKGYYSKDRQSEIVFDVSIELRSPGASSYWLLYLIECKDYGHAVPVNDVEEFSAKVQQVGGLGCKAVMISSNAFQEGALKFAASKHMGVGRLLSRSRLKWELRRSPSTWERDRAAGIDDVEVYRALTSEAYASDYVDFFGNVDGALTSSLRAFFAFLAPEARGADGESGSIDPVSEHALAVVPYVALEKVEEHAQKILDRVGYRDGVVPLDRICSQLASESGLVVRKEPLVDEDDDRPTALGEIQFDPPVITIFDRADRKPSRQRFTLAHEIGHYLLQHGEYLTSERRDEADADGGDGAALALRDVHRLEWQANRFASCLLMPRLQFCAAAIVLARSLGLEDVGFGLLYVDGQECNRRNYLAITEALCQRYEVSREAATIRLVSLDLLTDARTGGRPRHVSIR